MNKTTTRISYCLGILLILLNYSAYAQHVDGSSQSNPIIVPQSLATAYFSSRTDIVEVRYAFAINGGSASLILPPFIENKTNTELQFNLTSLNYSNYQGKVVEIQRQVLMANGTIDPSNKNYYVYPFTPSVALSTCDGKITARDNSNNDAGLKRTYELYQNGNLIGTPLDHTGSSFEFPYAIQAGLSYTVKIKIFSTGSRPGSNGFVYEGMSTSITPPTSPGLSANPSTVCSGKEVRLTANGGGSYQWSSGSQTGSQISVYPTATTTYSVSVTQGVGCPAIVRSVTVTVRATPTVSVGTSTPTICFGSGVQLRATGASNNTYNWSQANGDQSTFIGSTSGMIVNVQPIATTTYRVTVSDGQCEATAEQQITVNPSPSVSIDPIDSPVNVGTSLTLFGRASGGTWPYTYRWTTNATTSSINVVANTTTTYYLTVEDNKTCTAGAQVQVTVNPKPTVSISPVPNPICPGTSTPLNSTVSGGTTPYTYRWSTGATTANTNVAPTATTTYRLTVTDQQGKKDSTQVQVQVHPKPVPSIQGTQPNCVGQATVLTASGGSTYVWTDGATTATITVNPAQSTTYYVTVKNTYNCSAVDSFRVIVPAAIQLGYSIQNAQDCTPNNVTVVPNPLNAQAPLSYSIQRNGTTTLNPSLSNLTTDAFTLMVTDNKGCTASTLVSINEVPPLRITLSKESEHDCTPGNTRINMSTTGARGALSYRLDGGAPYTFTTYLNVPNGFHTVTAQDTFGCVASDTVRIAEDSLLVVAEPVIQHVTCPHGSDGSISLPVRGGSGTYYFNWSNLGSSTNILQNISAGEYAVTVVDSRNCQVIKRFMYVFEPGDIGFGAQRIVKHVTCNGGSDGSLEVTTPFTGGTAPYKFLWSNGDTTNVASNLSVGQYGVTITDAKGCQTAFWSTGIGMPAPININSTGQYTNHLDCIANNVSINVTATGGRGGYTYSLNGGTPQNSGVFTGQSNGTHQLEVKDSANCSQTFTIEVVEHVPFTLGYRLENDQDCIPYNTTIVPLPQNAQGAISYLQFRGSSIFLTPIFTGLSTTTYKLLGTDSKGCSAGVDIVINEKIPPLPIHLDTLTVCAGVPAAMSVQGAPTSGVSYVWTVPAGANNPGNVASFSATVAGVYSVIMTDTTTGCSISAQGEVRHTPGPDPDLCCSESICAGQSTYLSSNNYTPLSFAWSTGASTRGIHVNPVQSTTYTLTVTDAAGCKGTAHVSVQILPKPSVSIDSVAPTCGGDTLTLRAVVSSGTAPYVYYWGSGSSSSTFKVSPSSTSTYTVSITDVNGCMTSAQVVVPVRTRPNVELGADQIVCTGTNATLRADVLNGTAPFTYAWSNGATQSLINVVPATTTAYSVTVTDAIGCKSSDQVTVQVNPRPGLGFGSDTTICAGSSATLSANIIGGTAPFTYNWNNGSSASTLTVNPTSTSTYTLTVTDQKGCLAIGSTTVNVLPRPSVTVGSDRAICVGSSTTLSVSASSASPPLTYAWSTGASTSNLSISPIATTSYTITVTDSLTCSHSDTIIVVVNTTTAGIGGNSSACVGQNTTLTATGGGTYLWSTGASTASIVVSPSPTTTYSVTVTNQGCLDTAAHVLNVSTTNLSLIAPNILNTTDCQTGNIAFEVKYTGSSTPGLEFRMNGGTWQSSPWFTNRSAGTYLIEGRVVTATCILSLNSRNGNVSEASGATVIASISLANENDCTTGNTAITVNLTQSVSADYRLYPSPNWNTSKTFTNRSSGKYIVEVRPRNSSVCMERDTIEFDEKTASITSVNITGHDDCVQGNLRIEIASTGTPQSGPLQYRLNSSYSVSYATAWQNSNVFNNPANGSFLNRAEVKTSSGCIFVKNIDFAPSEVDPLNLSITGLTYISGATDCIKGNTRVSITTSTGEGVSVSQWRINGGAWTWSPEFYGLGRDSIFVEVRAYDDVRSCEVGKKLFVNERSIPDITQLVLSQHDDCTLNNAQISTQKTGGEGTISYKLNTGSFGSNPIFSNLGSGNYLVTVRDGNTCQDTMSVRITEPALLAATTTKANEGDCTGGNARITVSATGARGALSYSINGGTPQASNIFNNLSNGTYTVTAQDGVGCTVSKTVTVTESGALIATPFKTGETDCVLGNTSVAVNVTGALSTLSYRLNGGTAQASNVFNNLSNGSHTISVQDAGGCSTSTTFTVNEPVPLSLGTPQIQAVKCYGDASGSIGLNVSGGVTPYTITWSNGAQGAFIQYLPAGNYAFTVTDSRGCSVSGVVSVPSPSAFQVQLSNFVDVACHNGTTGAISAVVTGGMSPYTYRWSNSATTTSIANIAAGNYGLTVTDANGCVATATGSLANPSPLSLSHQVANDQDCIANNLSITALASGGRGNYTFSLNGGTPQASGLFTGKTTGTYTLTLQDGAGCSAEPLVLGLINEKLPPPLISIDTVRECVGTSASLSINGAPSTGMQYNWTVPNGANNPGNVAQFSTLIAGTYSVVMTDTATGCTRTASGVVVHKPLPIADVCCKDTICAGDSLTLHSNPGYATYLWSNGATTASNTVSPLATTTYTLTVTGINGCSATDQEIIVVNPQLVANAGTNKVICAGDTTLLSGSASGGIGPYTYHWSTGASTSTISIFPSGTTIYTLTVTDQQGCSDTSLVVVTVNPVPQVSDWQSPAQICKGDSSVIGVNGGTQYLWENGATTQSITVSPQVTTRYYVTISNEYLCSTTTNARVIVVDKPSLTISSDTAICAKDSLILSASAAGGTSPYTYNWSTGDNAASVKVSPLTTKTYTVILRDNQNCKDTAQVNIQVNPLPVVQILGKDSMCLGTNDTLRLQTSGGTLPYTYLWNTGSTTASLLVDTTSSVLYTVEVRDSNTCISRDSFALTINSLPVVQVKAADTLRCDNPQVLLAPLTASGSLQFQWKTSAGHTLADSSQVWVDSMDTYIVEVMDSVGCSSSDSTRVITYIPQIVQIDSFPSTHCDSANARIRIHLSNPGAWLYRIDSTEWDTSATFSGLLMGTYAISIAAPDTSCIIDTTITIGSREICIEICAGDSILIGKPGLNPWCMKWLPEDGLSNPDSSYTWVKPTNSTIYRLIITDDDGNILDSLIYNVTLCPQLSISPSTLNLCEQNNPILSAVGGSGPYIWRNQNGAIVGEGQTYAPTEPGTYTVQQSNNLALAASANVNKQLGNQKLQIEPGLAAICGDSVRLSVAGNFHNFVWRDGNGQTLSQKSYAFIKQQGTYTLTAEAGEGCVLDTQTTVFASGFALSIPAEDIVISCNKTRSLPYPLVETRYGSGIDSLLITAPEHYQFRAEWRKDCQSCGQVRLSIESEESIGGNTPCTKVIRRTWVARDECGRRATATQIIRWQDNTAPEFVQFPESDTLMWGWPLPTETPIVSDDCDATPKLSRTVDSTSTSTIKVVQIHWQARDTCGNTHTQTQIITYLKPAVEDSFNLSAKYACGDDFTAQTPSNQEPLGVLRPKTVIDAYGFSVQVTKVDGPEINATGVYSGEAVAMIPFTNKPARFRFNSLKINSSYEVLSGNLTSITDSEFKLPTFGTAQSNLDICLPPPPPPAGTNGENDSGFDADGKYVKQPPYEGHQPGDVFDPTRDPNGFDVDGIHVETGTIYNPQGCSAQGVDSLGQKCDPTGAGPYYWLNPNGLDEPPTGGGTRLANQVRDTLRPLVILVLKELKRVNDSLILELKADCDALRSGTDAAYAATGIGDRDLVFGTDDQFFKEGLAKSFESRPKLLPETVQREAAHFDLQKKHVKLFECDESLAKLRALSTLLLSLQEDPGLSSLVREMIERLKRVSDADTASINSITELIPWLSGQVSTYATNLNNFKFNRTGSIDATPATPHLKHSRDWGEQISTLNAPTPDASQQAAALLAEYESGAEYIGGVHRAFYLREIVRQRQSQWFVTDSLKIGASLFPIEISTESKGHKQSLLLDQMRVTSSGAYIDAYIIMNFLGKEIVLRADNVPLDPAGLKEDGKMYLVNDVEIRLSNAVMMVLKANTTYASWDCQGFDKAGLDLEFEFCEKIIVPVNPQTQQVIANARVKGRATAVIEDLNDFTVAINITPFALTNYPEVQISVQNAIADFSDTETPEQIKFPTGYTFPEGNYERWRGVYLGQVSVTLPISLAENGLNLAIGAENFIIDDQGVSGSAFAANLVSLSNGNFSGFAASVDTVRVDFLTNHFVGAGLVGNIHLPLFGKPEGAIGPEDCFRYRGRMEPKQGFKFAVLPREDMTMDLLKAKATILASSSIEMQYVGGRFKVRATLNGSIAIDTLGTFKTEKEQPGGNGQTAPGGQTKLGLALPPITFEKLVLSNEAPYLSPGIWTMPASASARLGKFKLGIDALKLVAREGNQAGLYVETRVELSDDHKVPAKGAFEIYGELKIENGRQRWVGKGLRIKRFTVDADIKGNTIKGEVFHFDGDSTSVFGSGFRGTLSVKFAKLGGAGIDALAQFGEVDGFKYFMVDVMATLPGAGIPLGPMYIKKLGGGLSNRMTRTDDVSFPTNWGSSSGSGGSAGELGTSLSGVQYYPSSERGLGLRLALMMTAEKEESFSATVSLEAIFNSKGGINTLALDGFIQFMTKPKPEMVPVKSGNNGLDDPKNSIPNASKVAGFISIKYNFDKDIFDANFRVFFNADNLRGSGDARFYFSPAKWFINIGEPEPSKRINLTMDVPGLPNNALVMTAYLNIGNGIPAMPPLPAHIRELTGLGATQGAESTRGSGNGFAFGADLSITTGELKFLILYANLNAGVGFDLQLQQYGGASCAGGGELGINGWYASGQLWAYVQAEVGLQLKKNGNKFPIASLSAGVALQGQLPNPFWARGSLAGRYKILGGLVKGKFNFKFTIGEPCQLVDENGQPVPEPELSLISELNPQNSAIGVSQIARPQAVFTLPMNKARVPMLDEEGNNVYYQTSLTKLELRDSLGQVIACGLTYSKDSLQITLEPYELLPANARFSLYTEATCSHNGQVLVTDRDSVSFRTGLVASGIPAENVAYSYPTVGMQSFYRYEKADRQGYIQLKLGQKELLGLGQPVFARFEGGGSTTETLVSYSNYDKRLSFDIPADALQPATGYTLSIVSAGKVLLSFPFRSSQYAYFKDKMAAFAGAASSSWKDWNLELNAPAIEPFDDAETLGQNGETPLVAFEMVIDNYAWYLNNFSKVYSKGAFTNFKGFEPLSRDVNASGPKGELALGFATGTTLENRLHAVLRQDLDDFKDQAALAEAQRLKTCGNDTSSRGCTKDATLDAFIDSSIPLPAAGSIPVMATYRLPGSKSVNSSTSFTLSFGAKTNIQN